MNDFSNQHNVLDEQADQHQRLATEQQYQYHDLYTLPKKHLNPVPAVSCYYNAVKPPLPIANNKYVQPPFGTEAQFLQQ